MMEKEIVKSIISHAPEEAIDFFLNIIGTTLMYYDVILSDEKKKAYSSAEEFVGEMLLSFANEASEVMDDEE